MDEFKMPQRLQVSNKGTFGKVLNVAGSHTYVGAAYLSTKAILKTGAGYVALVSDKNIINTVPLMLPEAVYLNYSDAIKLKNNFNVLLIGCGLGQGWYAQNLFKKFIKEYEGTMIPCLIDADGLNILSRMSNKFNIPENTIITPHPIEAARLLQVAPDVVINNLEHAAKMLSDKYSCVCVLKSHRTIVSYKNEIYINQCGNSALAKAGTGDVLSGIIAGLLAQKYSPFDAAKLGVYLHAKSGELASRELSEYCVLASDLFEYLPKVILNLK